MLTAWASNSPQMLAFFAMSVKHMECISMGRIPTAAITLDATELSKVSHAAGIYMTICDVFINIIPLSSWKTRRTFPAVKYPARERGPMPQHHAR